MRNRTVLGCVVCITLVGGSFWFLFRSPSHRINPEGYAGLQLGMTEREVHSVLGVPSGDYGPGKGEIVEGGWTVTSDLIRRDPRAKKWLAGDFGITVCFDNNARLRAKSITDSVYRPYHDFWEMLAQAVGLKEKRPYPGLRY